MKKIILTLTLAVACMFTYTCNKSNHSIQSSSSVFGMENLPFSEFIIDANSDTDLTGKSGTKLKIKKNTFLDSKGNLVHGPVNIELKEAINKIDIVLGNMTTLSNGKILESGGMIYVNAKSGDENLSIAENSSIEVGIPTENKNDSMQIYSAEIDSLTQRINWINPKNLIIKVKKANLSSVTQTDSIDNTNYTPPIILAEDLNPPTPPVKPVQSSGGDTILSLIFDTADFPEMAIYRNVKFKLRDTKNFREADTKREWMSMDLKKTNEQGIYIISFEGIDNTGFIAKQYKVSPIFEAGNDYKSAIVIYEKKFSEYQNKKAEIEKQRMDAEAKLRAKQDKANASRIAESIKNGINPNVTDPNTNYVFALNRLGWTNIDCFFGDPRTKNVEIKTVIENQNEFENIYISMIFENKNINLAGYEMKDKSYGFTHNDNEKPMLPVGENTTIIATCKKGDKIYSSLQRITIQLKQTVTLHLVETTMDKLKGEIMKTI